VKALQRSAQEAGRPLRLINAVEDVNDAQKRVLGEKMKEAFWQPQRQDDRAVGIGVQGNTDRRCARRRASR
jgi:UDPglucose 6-dehydrogenase